MAPDDLRELVEDAINYHLDQNKLAVLKIAEASEREGLIALARRKIKRTRKRKHDSRPAWARDDEGEL